MPALACSTMWVGSPTIGLYSVRAAMASSVGHFLNLSSENGRMDVLVKRLLWPEGVNSIRTKL